MAQRESDIPTPPGSVVTHETGAIGWITFDNPTRHNAMSRDMWQSLGDAVRGYAENPAILAVVLKGKGDRAFVAGSDISGFEKERSSHSDIREYDAILAGALAALQGCPKPTIAMIRGYCIGGGMAIAATCDIRFAADDARFAIPAAKRGIAYRFAGVKQLADIVGPAFAAEIFFTGGQFSASDALQMRFVNRIVPVEKLDSYVLDCAQTLASNAPLTIASIKRSLIEYRKDPTDRDLALCEQMADGCFTSEDYREGQLAFKERRSAVFKGR